LLDPYEEEELLPDLRRHLEALGAAAPEHDPEGCLAELDDLARLLRAHQEL